MLIQIVIRLVVYIDQYITRTSSSKEGAAVTTISSPQCAKAAGGGNSSFVGDYDSSSGDTSIFRGIDNTVKDKFNLDLYSMTSLHLFIMTSK